MGSLFDDRGTAQPGSESHRARPLLLVSVRDSAEITDSVAAGADIVELHGDDVRKASGSPAYSFALRHAAGGHVQPLSLTRGYARAAQARGAQLFHDTPVTSLERIDGKWRARCPKGEITADVTSAQPLSADNLPS